MKEKLRGLGAGALAAGLVVLAQLQPIEHLAAQKHRPTLRSAFEAHNERLGLDLEFQAKMGKSLHPKEVAEGFAGFYYPRAEIVRLIKNPAESYVSHEAAHHLVDQYNEEQGLGSYVWDDRDTALFVSEGIATYLEGRVVQPLEQALLAEENDLPYVAGLALVAPIMQHGEAGLRYLLLKEPNDTTLASLQAYQRSAIEYLTSSDPRRP